MRAVLSSLLWIWAGLMLGVAFVATPAKFMAESVPLPQLLDVGRWTFHVLARIEWPLAVASLLVLVMWRSRVGPPWSVVAACLAGVVGMLALESFWLRPILDARLIAIMEGRPVPPSQLHELYIGLEVVRLLLILAAAGLLTVDPRLIGKVRRDRS